MQESVPPKMEDVLEKIGNKLPVCRVCLNISMEYIDFDSVLCLIDGVEITYSNGFDIIAPSLIDHPDKLVNSLCSSCGTDLLNAFLFRKRVENANIILNDINNYFNKEKESLAYQEDRRREGGESKSLVIPADLTSEYASHMCMDVDMFDDEGESFSVCKITKIRKAKENETWPASPKNSLYTDTDTDSSIENEFAENQLQNVSSNRFKEPTIWMCSDCGEIYMTQRMLSSHRKQHKIENNKEIKCGKCNDHFETITELESHLCFHKFSELIALESGKQFYQCKLCKRKYRSKMNFNDHINIHKGKKPYICKNCLNAFYTKHMLRVHAFRCHKTAKGKTRKSKNRAAVGKKEKCLDCNKMVNKSFMEIHKEVHFGPQNSICNDCGKEFGSRLALRTHTLIHKQSGEYLCHICNKMCQTMYALKSHIQFKHIANRSLVGSRKLKYQCEDCGLVFQYPSKLKVHQRKHTAEAPYKCQHCNRNYLRKDQFIIHMRYHNNYLPYKCERCDKSYATKNNLTEHTRSVHDNITYSCDNCDLKFKSVTGLRKHKFLHTGYPYVCPICGLGQPFRSGIKAHLLRVHKDTFTEEEFDKTFPVLIPKSGFRRPKS